MHCPFCASTQLEVVNSRPTKSGTQVWRRRRCSKCKESFSTYERVNLSYLVVVKKSGIKQKYSRAKLYSGIYHSTLDRRNADRGELSVLSELMTSEVEARILKLHKKTIPTVEIKEMVLEVLSHKSPDSLLRYIAHRDSDDIKLIKRTIKKYFKNFVI